VAFARNLLAGLRLFAFLPVERRHFAPSPRQAVLLAAVALAVWIGLDRLQVDGAAEIDGFEALQAVAVGALATALFVLLAPRSASAELATAVAAASPFLVSIAVLVDSIEGDRPASRFAAGILPAIGAAVLYRAQRIATQTPRIGAACRAVLVAGCTAWLLEWAFGGVLEFWFPPDEEVAAEPDERAGDAERDLFRQPELVDAAVSQLAPGRKGVIDTYFLGFAGDGHQRVFEREVRFARQALADRIDLAGRSVLLINAPNPDRATPLATISGLRRALAGIAKRMNLDEDVLVLFMTSHGSEDAELTVAEGDLPLDPLRGEELRDMLDRAHIRWRIIVISACHSASFLPFLEHPQTLVATASRADRRSFGCSGDRDLTYFGEALFRDALPASEDWLRAVARAREVVERHERDQKVADSERSEPQLFVGARMREKLAELKFHRVASE